MQSYYNKQSNLRQQRAGGAVKDETNDNFSDFEILQNQSLFPDIGGERRQGGTSLVAGQNG